jgi:transforming growth factor-beta-induced protein
MRFVAIVRVGAKQITAHTKMKKISILTVAAILTAVTLTPSAIGAESGASKTAPTASSPAAKDIVAVASGAGSFNTLVAAVKAAGLVETLQGTGPFTVFAPTDEAFAKLPAGTVENLLKPENKAQLVAILTYHVVAGKVMAADVKTMQAKTVNGKELSIKVADGKVTVDGAKVIKTDVAASNGVIHVIDTVVLPKG